MNRKDPEYNKYHLVNEMYDAVGYIRDFNPDFARGLMAEDAGNYPFLLTGEGSSRIFPAKNAVHRRLDTGKGRLVLTESSTDLTGKDLSGFIVIGASNSGRTKELINLFKELKDSGHPNLYGLTCNSGSLLEKYTNKTVLIDTGSEKAVAATKSVVAQALFYDSLLMNQEGEADPLPAKLAGLFEQALDGKVDRNISGALCSANMVYFAGYNNGVAEELTLKTNEIIRKRSAFLPGTYLLHGIEEVVTPDDVIVMVDAYPSEFEKIKSIYTDKIGATVIMFSPSPTPFPTLVIPGAPSSRYETYLKLAAGWNLLVEAGIELGIDLDKPQRARKIGNEAET